MVELKEYFLNSLACASQKNIFLDKCAADLKIFINDVIYERLAHNVPYMAKN